MLNESVAPSGVQDDANRDSVLAQAMNGSAASDHDRISARSFRMLTERLKTKSGAGNSTTPGIKLPPRIRTQAHPVLQAESAPEPEAPAPVPVDLQAIIAEVVHEIVPAVPAETVVAQAPVVEPLAAPPAPAIPDVVDNVPPGPPAMELPVFSPPEMFFPQMEDETAAAPDESATDLQADLAPSAELIDPAPIENDGEFTAALPQPDLDWVAPAAEAQPEPLAGIDLEPVQIAIPDDEPPVGLLVSFDDVTPARATPPDIEPEPPAEAMPPEPDVVLAGSASESEDSDVPVNPLTDRVVEAMIKTIADQVYAKPSASERAAFLREIADLVEKDGASVQAANTEPEVVPPVVPVAAPHQATEPKPDAEVLVVQPPPEPEAEDVPIADMLATRAGVDASLLRPKSDTADPFSKDVAALARFEPRLTETQNADEESGDLALSLLDMMSAGSASGLPQERALAADTLLRILPRIPVKQLLAVVERVAIMETPPALLVAKLIRDPRPEVVAPLLERCMHITDQDLIAAAIEADTAKQRMIARRRILSPVLADQLIALGDPSVVLTLIRNPGATFSHDAFYDLAEIASQHHALLAPLATRADLPPPVAFELFWFLPPELRRFVFSRFLTDSETLNKILRITLATYGEDGEQSTEMKFPPRDVLDGALDHAAAFRLEDAAEILAECAGVSKETALRIFADREGEPITVILKALGYQRGRFTEAMERLRTADMPLIRPDRPVEELQTIFDSLSFNKARILLTYWDWYVRKAGPYAPRN